MHSPKLLILFIFFLSYTLNAQDSLLSTQILNEDFKIFRGTLEEMHPGLYWYQSKAELDDIFNQSERKISNKLSLIEFYRELLKIASELGCGHVWIDAPEPLESNLWKEDGKIPLDIKIIDSKLYCLKNYDSASKLKSGDQITSINGHQVDNIIADFLPYTVGDGIIETGRIRLIEQMFDFFYRLNYGMDEVFTIAYYNETGQLLKTKLKGFSEEQLEGLKNNKSVDYANLELTPIDSLSANLQIKHFYDWKDGKKEISFKREIDQIFRELHSTKIKNLIIDLRDNGGGKGELGRLVLSYLIREPILPFKPPYVKFIDSDFKQYTDLSDDIIKELGEVTNKLNDTLYLTTHKEYYKPITPNKYAFNGKIFILINGNTFSASSDLAAILKSLGRAIFIGEETAGSYYGNSSGNFVFVTLPNTGFKTRIPIVGYYTNVNSNVEMGRGIIPDYELEPNIDEIINDNDPELELAIKLIIDQN